MTFVQVLVIGLLIGSVYGLFSVGLMLVFGVLCVVNFVYGEFVMIGMYGVYSILLWLYVSFYVVILVVIVGMVGIGVVFYYICFYGECGGVVGYD